MEYELHRALGSFLHCPGTRVARRVIAPILGGIALSHSDFARPRWMIVICTSWTSSTHAVRTDGRGMLEDSVVNHRLVYVARVPQAAKARSQRTGFLLSCGGSSDELVRARMRRVANRRPACSGLIAPSPTAVFQEIDAARAAMPTDSSSSRIALDAPVHEVSRL